MSNEYRTKEESQTAGVTYHLIPTATWDRVNADQTYVPEAFDADGFIHCTDGLEPLLKVANMFYQDVPGDYSALVLDTKQIDSEIRYDDPDRSFPHIYGPLNLDSVLSVLPVSRNSQGKFFAIGSVSSE